MEPHGAPAPLTHAQRLRVYYEDTDAGGIVYYANWLRFLERVRTDWLRALGIGHRELAERDGLAFVVRDLSIEYLRPARLDDEIEVDVRLTELRRASMRLAQRARLAAGADGGSGNGGNGGDGGDASPLVVAGVRIAVIERDTGRPAPLPSALHDLLRAALAASPSSHE